MSAIGINRRSNYAAAFIGALLVASFLPLTVGLLNFDIANQKIAQLATLYSFVVILGGAHVWMTIAYYVQPPWLKHFISRPVVFFVVPALITAFFVLCAIQPNMWIGLAPIYAVTFINLWHHSKQNWGVISLASRIEKGDVSGIQKPLIYAWPFFLIPWAGVLPGVSAYFGDTLVWTLSIASVLAYVGWAFLSAVRSGFFKERQPAIILVFGFAMLLYFVPLVAMRGRPYVLIVWAAAHALQYYLIVIYSLMFRKRGVTNVWNVLASGAVSIALLAGLTYIAHVAAVRSAPAYDIWVAMGPRLVLAIITAVNLIHFWIDAFIWKFSDKTIRDLHGQAFNFS